MILVIALFVGFFALGVALVLVDASALREQRQKTAKRERDSASLVEEAERWLQDH